VTIQLDDLTIRYGAVTAVDRASATFPRGAVGLLGRNGAGKTSILKAVLGFVRPAGGAIRVLDMPPDLPATELRRRIGYMPERDTFVPGLNGFETVALLGELSGMPRLEARRRAHEVLYLVGLDEAIYRPVAGFSLGMRQRVKLAAALAHDPDLLFLDEPTNGLDPNGRRHMLALIRRLAELGKSVVLSTHILQDVETTCESVVVMERGRVLEAGSVAELTRGARQRLLLDADGEPARLLAALQSAGQAELAEPASQDAAAGVLPQRYRLVLDAGVSRAAIFAAVAAAGGTVQRLSEERRTLEQMFLSAVGREPVGAGG
jgi:ABC-2 type transport system ATP-binding protein